MRCYLKQHLKKKQKKNMKAKGEEKQHNHSPVDWLVFLTSAACRTNTTSAFFKAQTNMANPSWIRLNSFGFADLLKKMAMIV